MSNKKQIKISKNDLKQIFSSDYHDFEEKIIPNAYCPHGDQLTTTIVDYQVFINHLDDVILKGKCVKCGKPIARYLETGEVEKYWQEVRKIRSKILKKN